LRRSHAGLKTFRVGRNRRNEFEQSGDRAHSDR
jgi:hypothetical protein